MSEKTHKTEPLMKLLNRSGGSQIENPIINNDFKHDVIHANQTGENQLRNSHRLLQRELMS